MKKLFLNYLFFLFFSINLFSQAYYDKVILMDSLQKPTNSNDFFFKKIIKKYNIPADNYKFIVYNKFNKKIKEGFYLDKDGEDYDGELILYYDNGDKRQRTIYVKGKRHGKFTSWYEDGNVKEEGSYYLNNSSKGEYKVDNLWNEEKIQTVTNGNGYYQFKDSIVEVKGQYKNGRKNDAWTRNFFKSNVSMENTYKEGIFISGVRTISDGTKIKYDTAESKPFPNEGFPKFFEYIGNNFNQNMNYEYLFSKGVFKISFIIDKDGKIVEPEIIKGMNKKLNDELIRVLLNAKPWTPGYQLGFPVRVKYTLPITITFSQ
jgi:antitoxin component YwqK of YwqJK toxin-antitoxin module